ncbi:glycosyltransferase family 4 protein [Caldilinea sp.]|uniref:glycosyltransferase family 4 protein n=1 Tax=Caldilinea sp. TaxID=2293560 RepID=UPI00261F7F77|nr:glycosyltransferase family 4 protein [uncultured Caldilinea sp.]
MRVLFLSRWFPFPTDNGSKIRVYHLLKSLADQHEVALLSFANESPTAAAVQVLREICSQVDFVSYKGFQTNSVRARLGFLSPTPRSLIDTFSAEMAEKVKKVSGQWKPDIVVASQLDMIPYALLVRDVFRVAEEIELTVPYEAYIKASHLPAKLRKGLTWWKLSAYLRRTLSAFQLCTVVSSPEQTLARRVIPSTVPVEVIPNGVDVRSLRSVSREPQPDVLIYNGALSYYANFDAMHFFLSAIFPRILERAPKTTLLITGNTRGAPIEQLPNRKNVVFTGYVEDIHAVVGASWALVAPLRLGGGTRLKVLEALALGVPVVATSKGVEGLDLEQDKEVLVADTPQRFAEATLSLLTDPALRNGLSLAGRRAANRYDWNGIGRRFNQIVTEGVSPSSAKSAAIESGNLVR